MATIIQMAHMVQTWTKNDKDKPWMNLVTSQTDAAPINMEPSDFTGFPYLRPCTRGICVENRMSKAVQKTIQYHKERLLAAATATLRL